MPAFQLIIGNKNYSSWSLRPWLLLRKLSVSFEETQVLLQTEDFKQQVTSAGFTPSANSANSRVYLAPLRRPRLPGNFFTSQKSAQLVGPVFSLSAL